MSVDERLNSLLLNYNLDVEQGEYTGQSESYITFNLRTVPVGFADDTPEWEKYLIEIHLFGPLSSDLEAIAKKISAALFENDFAYPSKWNADDKYHRHLILETEYVEVVGV